MTIQLPRYSCGGRTRTNYMCAQTPALSSAPPANSARSSAGERWSDARPVSMGYASTILRQKAIDDLRGRQLCWLPLSRVGPDRGEGTPQDPRQAQPDSLPQHPGLPVYPSPKLPPASGGDRQAVAHHDAGVARCGACSRAQRGCSARAGRFCAVSLRGGHETRSADSKRSIIAATAGRLA
jgi:hypothetical protein